MCEHACERSETGEKGNLDLRFIQCKNTLYDRKSAKKEKKSGIFFEAVASFYTS